MFLRILSVMGSLRSVMLSSELAVNLDQAIEHLECSPSGLVGALLEDGEVRPEEEFAVTLFGIRAHSKPVTPRIHL